MFCEELLVSLIFFPNRIIEDSSLVICIRYSISKSDENIEYHKNETIEIISTRCNKLPIEFVIIINKVLSLTLSVSRTSDQ